jgi:DNA-binding response OmpR family regulator
LPEFGFDVVVARTSTDGLTLLRTGIADVVVLDLRLPDGHGRDWLREKRRLRIDTPVLIMSGFPDDVSPGEARELGASGPYAKPFRLEELALLLVTAAAPPNQASRLADLFGRLDGLRDERVGAAEPAA